MTHVQVTYFIFCILLVLALIFDLGLISRKNKAITLRQAMWQSVFWVGLGLAFFGFMWFENGRIIALEYLSAYVMEKGLSIDNIFVFIIIFSAFGVREQFIPRVLLYGILIAIILRVLFITVGVALVERFHWILYVFGVFLVYTGYKMFVATEEHEFNPRKSKVFQFMKKALPLIGNDGNGKFTLVRQGKRVYTTLFVVVVMLGATDLVFAVDSIPAVMGISLDKMVIYTSNIFAVLGLRALFFLLRSAVSKFDYLQQGISVVLIFIGVKMLTEHWLNLWIGKQTQVLISLGVILVCIAGSILFSIWKTKPGLPHDVHEHPGP